MLWLLAAGHGKTPLSTPILNQLNLVVQDMEQSIAFYRLLGLDIPESAIWRTSTGAHHVEVRMPGGFELELDSPALAEVYNAGWRPSSDAGSRIVMSFHLADAAAVDETHRRMADAGHATAQPPYYTFWGSRYAVVIDPDGNHVGLISPPDNARRGRPPNI